MHRWIGVGFALGLVSCCNPAELLEGLDASAATGSSSPVSASASAVQSGAIAAPSTVTPCRPTEPPSTLVYKRATRAGSRWRPASRGRWPSSSSSSQPRTGPRCAGTAHPNATRPRGGPLQRVDDRRDHVRQLDHARAGCANPAQRVRSEVDRRRAAECGERVARARSPAAEGQQKLLFPNKPKL